MITETFIKRNFYSQSGDFSFLLNLLVSNLTGVANFGFSGDSSVLNFSFKSGKFLDNNNNFIYAYQFQTNDYIAFSGDVSQNTIDYYINNVPFAFGLGKPTGNLDYFYIDPQNCLADFQLYINGDKPNYTITNSINYNTGTQDIPITITNNSLPFRIFSGNYRGNRALANINPFPTGYVITTTGFNISQSGSTTGISTFPFDLYTNFGVENITITGIGSGDPSSFYYLNASGPTSVRNNSSISYYCTFGDVNDLTVLPYLQYISGDSSTFFDDWDLRTGLSPTTLISYKYNYFKDEENFIYTNGTYTKNIGAFYIYVDFNADTVNNNVVALGITGVNQPTGFYRLISGVS